MSEEKTFQVRVERQRGFRFEADFGLEGVGPLLMDEPGPVGEGTGPNAERVLAAAIGDCLSASLLFCLERSRVEVSGIRTTVSGVMARNPEGRWRIKEIGVDIEPQVDETHRKQLERCAEIFEQFCIVTQSVRQGIPIRVNVRR
jgi:organic hydroperoxide reductase OsmC/OhrA